MPDFKLSRERVEDAVNVIIQFLRDSGYNGSLEDGTGLNDVVIKPSSVIYELMAQLADRAGAYQSLQRAIELRDVIGQDEYDNAVDCVLSNWFVTRNDGKPSTGLVRMWFLQPLDFMSFADGQNMGGVDGNSFVADGDQVFTEKDFSCILNTAENQDEYYVDVAVRTVENTSFAPSFEREHTVNMPYNDIYYLRSTIPGTFTPGITKESSPSFIRRTEKAITTRELITDRAINTVLLDTFDDIIRLYVARHGSGEQLRDIVDFEGIRIHVGNKADIYIASQITKQELEVHVDADGTIDTDQLPSSTTIIDYIGAVELQPVDESGTDFVEIKRDIVMGCVEKTWLGTGIKPTSLKLDGVTGECTARLTLLSDGNLSGIHNFVYSKSQRVACYDPMVKHMFPLVLRPIINAELTDTSIDSAPAIKDALLKYISYIVTYSQPWISSELVTTIHTNVPNVKKILLPISCPGTIYDPLTQKHIQCMLGSKFTVGVDLERERSVQITDNTVQFYTDLDLIKVVTNYEPAE